MDKNTCDLFDLEQGVPTDAYELELAVSDEFLVPPKSGRWISSSPRWQPPKVDFLPIIEVLRRVGRLWPAILGGAFAIGLLGAKIGDGDFEDFSLLHTIGQTVGGLFGVAVGAWLVFFFLDAVSRSGTKEQGRAEQAPGELFVTVFVLIYLYMVFGGYFSPVPQDEGRESEYSEPWE